MPRYLNFRTDLYQGTAEYYDEYRPPYPVALLDDLQARARIGAASRVLDLACGTGQIAFPLAASAAEVLAVDQEAESVEFARRKARRLGVSNIEWTTATAERVELDGLFDLVAIGNAFHRLDREVVARHLIPHLRDGGCVALLWAGMPWEDDEPRQHALQEWFERWIDALETRGRVPAGWEQLMQSDPHADVLRRAGLRYEGRFEFDVVQRWTVESLIGFAYSTSLLNRSAVGDRAGEFERDLREQLSPFSPAGGLEQRLSFAYELARRV